MAKSKVPQGDVSTHAAQTKPDITVTDQHSALHAIAMRNHGTTGDERNAMVSDAAQYAPNDAANANDYDQDCDSDMAGRY